MGIPLEHAARGPGRPRDPDLESRVFAAALKVYAEAGWSGFSFEAVARLAGVGKAPLYLRWNNKEDLLLAALSAHYSNVSITDSGNLRDDLVAYAARLLESKASPDGWAFLRIHLEATVIPALHARFSSQIAIPHVEGARALLHRAVDRGAHCRLRPVRIPRASSAVRIASAHCLGAVTEVSTSTSYSRNVCTRAC